MYFETMVLFDQVDDSPSPASLPKRLARADADRLLESVVANSSRKSAHKALSQQEREELADAVALVASHKRASYDSAQAGETPSAHGWIVAKPDLAAATALLNRHFIVDVPMADRHDVGG